MKTKAWLTNHFSAHLSGLPLDSAATSDLETLLSHQLRTPLSSIKWHTEMMLDGDTGCLTTDQHKYLQSIHDSYRQTAVLIDSLLQQLADPSLNKIGA